MYDPEHLVLRRGFMFMFKVTFDRQVTAQDMFQVHFRIGVQRNVLKKTLVVLSFRGLEVSGPWRPAVVQQGTTLVVRVIPDHDALIGRYKVVVGVAVRNGLQMAWDQKQTIYMIFNTWNQYDDAFMPQQADIYEYVLNETGIIYMGNFPHYGFKKWVYGQFEKGVLDACIYVMDKSQLPIVDRGDVVKVCRMASAMINSLQDEGVLIGNWSNDFSGGTPPTQWTGSPAILVQYHKSERPVAYAQCWVYAGVLNTFLRCLGLACRVITNLVSAHDNDGNLHTDLVFKEDLTPDHDNTHDSVWNYHCWNEVYMKRPDIPKIYSGWQVLDSTPQETSDGYHRCGPFPTLAVKEGMLCYPFDGRFIFGEVEGDVRYHVRDKYGNTTLVHVDKTKIGKLILTQNPHGSLPLDLTLKYKYHESDVESSARALAMAESYGCRRAPIELPPTSLDIRITTKEGYVGKPVEANVEFVNKSDSPLKASMRISWEAIYYTGVPATVLSSQRRRFDLGPNSTEQLYLMLPPERYLDKLGAQAVVKLTVTVNLGQNRIVTESSEISLDLQLRVEAPSPVHVGSRAMVTVSFVNPLNVRLERPEVDLEGAGLLPRKTKHLASIEPFGSVRFDEEFRPYAMGNKELVVNMVSKNHYTASGSVPVKVLPPYWYFGGRPRSGRADGTEVTEVTEGTVALTGFTDFTEVTGGGN